MKKQLLLLQFFLLVVVVSFLSCKKDDPPTVTNEIHYPSDITVHTIEQRLTENGWKEFILGNYSQAIDSFSLAISANSFYTDAYNGLGWSYARMDSLEEAHYNLTVCMVSPANERVYKDARACRSFINLALGEYVKAIEDVDAVILEQFEYYYNYKDYAFRHDPSISQNDLVLVVAESYFMLGNYPACYEALFWIDDSIEQTNDPEELAMIIEELKQTI